MLDHFGISEVVDRLKVMRLQEEKSYKCRDYISDFKRRGNAVAIDEECRKAMCAWCYQVVDFCHFQREIVSIAFSYLDRYLCTEQGQRAICDTAAYQLASMTTLYLAVKVHETVSIDPSLLAQLSRDAYREEQFEEMEMQILVALGWKVNGPTPLAFLQCFVDLLPCNSSIDATIQDDVVQKAQHEVEIAVSDYNLSVNHLPSEIALRAIANVIEDIDDSIMPFDVKRDFIGAVKKFSGLHIDDILDAQSCLYPLLVAEPDTAITISVPGAKLTPQKRSHPISPTSLPERDYCLL